MESYRNDGYSFFTLARYRKMKEYGDQVLQLQESLDKSKKNDQISVNLASSVFELALQAQRLYKKSSTMIRKDIFYT